MYNFKAKINHVLEIYSQEIKWVVLETGVVRTLSLPPGAISQGAIKQFDALYEVAACLLKDILGKGQEITLSLAPELTLSKKVHLPAVLNEKERELEIATNLERYFPRSNELAFDYVVQPGSESDQVEVLIVAIPFSQIRTYQALASQLQLRINSISSKVTPLKINLLPWRDKRYQQRKRIKQGAVLLMLCILSLLSARYYMFISAPSVPLVSQPSREAVSHWIAERKVLHDLQYVGFLHQSDKTWGLIKFPKGEIKDVKVNDYIGVGSFKVVSLNEDAIVLRANHHRDFILQRNH